MVMGDYGLETDWNANGIENLAVKLTGNSVECTANPKNERVYATGVLLHDALGLKAKFDSNGHPITEVRFKIVPQNIGNFENTSSGIANLHLQNGERNPFPSGGVIILNLARYDSEAGIIKSGWMETAVRNPESGLEACLVTGRDGIPNLMTVEPERCIERLDGLRCYHQSRLRVLQTEAVEFAGIRDFKRRAVALLDKYPKHPKKENNGLFDQFNPDGHGYPCIAIRGIELHENEGGLGLFAYTRRIELNWNQLQDSRMSPNDAINQFLNNKFNASWIEAIKNSSKKIGFFEIIPLQRYNTSKGSLPSSHQKSEAMDDSNLFLAPVLDEFDNLVLKQNSKPAFVHGFAGSIMLVNRNEKAPDNRWLVRKNIRINLFGPIAPLAEIQTPNLPDELRARLQFRNEKRASIIREYHNKREQNAIATATESSANGLPEFAHSETRSLNNNSG